MKTATIRGPVADRPFAASSRLDISVMTDSTRISTAPAAVPSDEALLDAFKTGDRNSFNQLVRRYERELYHYLVRFLNDRQAAEDIFQETFLQIYQSAVHFNSDRRFRPWMFTIAANKARDLMRARARRPASPLQALMDGQTDDSGEFVDLMQATQSMPDASLEEDEIRQKVQEMVAALPDHLREILLLSYFHGFPHQQISTILQIPVGTVKSRLHAAVAYFANQWKSQNRGQLSA